MIVESNGRVTPSTVHLNNMRAKLLVMALFFHFPPVLAETDCTKMKDAGSAVKCLQDRLEQLEAQTLQGVWCGLDSKSTIAFPCMGSMPSEKCPEGYQRFSISLEEGNLITSIGEGKHYTCIKS